LEELVVDDDGIEVVVDDDGFVFGEVELAGTVVDEFVDNVVDVSEVIDVAVVDVDAVGPGVVTPDVDVELAHKTVPVTAQLAESVTVTEYEDPAVTAIESVVDPSLQSAEYGELPPDTLAFTKPVEQSVRVTSNAAKGSLIIELTIAEQSNASVMVHEYDPALTPASDGEVAPLLQMYEKGTTPPDCEKETAPLKSPLH
jgi:hypothetical protein